MKKSTEQYEGATLDVYVERISPKSSKQQDVELKWQTGEYIDSIVRQNSRAISFVYLMLIRQRSQQTLLGTIVSVQITGSASLLLLGGALEEAKFWQDR